MLPPSSTADEGGGRDGGEGPDQPRDGSRGLRARDRGLPRRGRSAGARPRRRDVPHQGGRTPVPRPGHAVGVACDGCPPLPRPVRAVRSTAAASCWCVRSARRPASWTPTGSSTYATSPAPCSMVEWLGEGAADWSSATDPRARGARSGGAASARCRRGRRRTPCGRRRCRTRRRRTSRRALSSVARAAATSSTCSAMWLALGLNSPMPMRTGSSDAQRHRPGLELGEVALGAVDRARQGRARRRRRRRCARGRWSGRTRSRRP